MFENSEIDYIGFRTDMTLTADDLVSLSSSVSTIYNVFLSYSVRLKHERLYYKNLEKNIEKQFHLYERFIDHPIHYDMFKYWRRYLKEWAHRRGPIPPPPLPFPFQQQQFDIKIPSEEEIFEKIRRYSSENDRLRVHKIRVSSPGGFSFSGIGEIVKELRELIKDVWYRNKQEKTMGQLEIIDKCLSMKRDHYDDNIPSFYSIPDGSKLAEVVDAEIEKLKRLESERKLRSVPEYLDYDPDKMK